MEFTFLSPHGIIYGDISLYNMLLLHFTITPTVFSTVSKIVLRTKPHLYAYFSSLLDHKLTIVIRYKSGKLFKMKY